MSEASDSLQVKTGDADACIVKLRESGFNGLVFRGDRGWLTVVPYGGPGEALMLVEGRIESLAGMLGAPVVNYVRPEDFGWSFAVVLPDGRGTAFECYWDPFLDEAHAPDAEVDWDVLAEVASVERIRPFLGPPVPPAGETGAAKDFAQEMGFPQFEWLSPAYVLGDPEDAVRRGGERIGNQPVRPS